MCEGISVCTISTMFTQLITPNPAVSGREGMCLEYVRKAFDRPVVSPRAIDAWDKSIYKHENAMFPAGCDVPVWFTLAGVPAGHVALRMSDGTVYSTSDYDPSPVHHHSSLNDLMAYYAYYGKPLTYLGWTEDIDGFPVVGLSVQTESAVIEGNDDMAGFIDKQQAEDIAQRAAALVLAGVKDTINGALLINKQQAEDIAQRAAALVKGK